MMFSNDSSIYIIINFKLVTEYHVSQLCITSARDSKIVLKIFVYQNKSQSILPIKIKTKSYLPPKEREMRQYVYTYLLTYYFVIFNLNNLVNI